MSAAAPEVVREDDLGRRPDASVRRRRWQPVRVDGWGVLLLPLVVFLVLVLVLPLLVMLVRSFTDPALGFGNYRDLAATSLYLRVLLNTFVTAAAVVAVSLLIAFPYAYVMTLATPFWRGFMLIAVLVPFWTSLLVRSFALVLLLRDTGVLNTVLVDSGLTDEPLPIIRHLSGVIFGMVQVTLPFAVLPMYATMRGIDRRLVQAAEGLGARPISAFWRVFAPLAVPGVAAALLLVFIQSLGFYITPALLGGPSNMMIGELIVQQVSGVLRFGFAAALGVVLLVSTLVLLALVGRVVDLRQSLMGRP